MTRKIRVRIAVPGDLDFVHHDPDIPKATIRRMIEERAFVVAELHRRPAGFVRLEYLWSKTPFIALIWVEPELRHQGVGRALLSYIELLLEKGGHRAIYSSSVVAEPEPQAWHRQMGFEECGIINGINPHKVGEIFFRKKLARSR